MSESAWTKALTFGALAFAGLSIYGFFDVDPNGYCGVTSAPARIADSPLNGFSQKDLDEINRNAKELAHAGHIGMQGLEHEKMRPWMTAILGTVGGYYAGQAARSWIERSHCSK
jgi:hypothetical protein